jgi:hypothetical protein
MKNLIKFTKFKHKQVCFSLKNNSYNKESFIHTSAIFYSDNINVVGLNTRVEARIEAEATAVVETSTEATARTEELLRKIRRDPESLLAKIRYKENIVEGDIKEIMGSSYNEDFSWFIDEKGRTINNNKPITLFNGIKLIANYLERRYDIDFISEEKITKLLEIFKDNQNITVLDLFKHVGSLYNQDKTV